MLVQTVEPESHEKPHELLVTVQIPIKVWDMPDFVELTGFADNFERVVNAWSDGRYNFYSEMFRVGLAQELQNALARSMSTYFMKKYGREMVKEGNRETAKWWLELQNFEPKPSIQLDTIGATKIEIHPDTSD